MEHRWGERHRVNIPVRLGAQPGVTGVGRLINFSLSGAWVHTALALTECSPVELTLPAGYVRRHPGWRACGPLTGHVVRTGRHGIGVEWDQAAWHRVAGLMQRAARPPGMLQPAHA